MSKKKDNKSRRDFLRLGLTAGISSAAGIVGAGLTIDKTRASTGEKATVLTTDGRLVEVDKSYLEEKPEENTIGRKESMKGLPDRRFVMVIDLAKCTNARKCVDACQEGHYLPKDHEWMKLYYLKDAPNAAPYWFPKPCFHCDNPMCVSVCPVGATYKRSDGIVLVDAERCIGCKFCMTGCPYSARVFHWKKPEVEPPDVGYSPETNVPAVEGTVGKCVWCADLLRKGKLPRCVTACPMGVIYFGDLVEDAVTNGVETVRFSQLVKERAGYRHREDLGTHPTVYYLPPVNRIFPVERGLENQDDEIKKRYEDYIEP